MENMLAFLQEGAFLDRVTTSNLKVGCEEVTQSAQASYGACDECSQRGALP